MRERRSARYRMAWGLGLVCASALGASGAPMPPVEGDDLRDHGVEIRSRGDVEANTSVRRVSGIGSFQAPAGFGWEDSAFITGDGRTLLFAYSQISGKQLVDDTELCIESCLRDCARSHGGLPDGLPACGPICSDPKHPQNPGNACTGFLTGPDRPGQQGAQFDIYQAQLQDGTWQVTNLGADFNTGYPEGAAATMPGEWLVFTRFREEVLAPKVWGGDLLFSAWHESGGVWKKPVVAPRGDHRSDPTVINSLCREDNAHIIPRAGGGLIAYWESDRNPEATPERRKEPACLEIPRFWVAELSGPDAASNAQWTTPVPVLIEGLEDLTVHTQIFVTSDGNQLIFTGGFGPLLEGCWNRACIYRMTRSPQATGPEGPFEKRTVLARATAFGSATDGDVLTFGDSSITDDGQLLYFTYIQQCGDDDHTPPITCNGETETWDFSIGVMYLGDYSGSS